MAAKGSSAARSIAPIMRRGMFQIFALLILGLYTYGAAIDCASPGDPTSTGAEACLLCACQPHLAEIRVDTISPPVEPKPFRSFGISDYDLLLQKSVFHPPKAIV